MRMRSRLRDSGDPDLPLREIRTDRLTLVFVPAVGGRLLSLQVDGRELLWRNPRFFDAGLRAVRPRREWPRIDGTFASWANVGGSKSWPAPQGWGGPGEWAGPPDEILDAGPWVWDESDAGDGLIVTLTSSDDPRTGLRLERRFTIPARGTAFEQTLTLTNVAATTVTWAPWEVCQVDTAPIGGRRGTIRVPVEGGRAPLELGDYAGALSVTRTGEAIEVPVQDVVAKRGFADAVGSITWNAPDGAGLTLEFSPQDLPYPDGGARVELWMQAPLDRPLPELSGLHPDAHLAELEVLGPLATLAPGERTRYGIGWLATPPSGPSGG
jgi:hypothetical protein